MKTRLMCHFDLNRAKIEKEKKEHARQHGMIRTEFSGGEIAEEMEKERQLFQLQMCEVSHMTTLKWLDFNMTNQLPRSVFSIWWRSTRSKWRKGSTSCRTSSSISTLSASTSKSLHFFLHGNSRTPCSLKEQFTQTWILHVHMFSLDASLNSRPDQLNFCNDLFINVIRYSVYLCLFNSNNDGEVFFYWICSSISDDFSVCLVSSRTAWKLWRVWNRLWRNWPQTWRRWGIKGLFHQNVSAWFFFVADFSERF